MKTAEQIQTQSWQVQTLSSGDIYIQNGPDSDIAKVLIPYPSHGESGEPEVMLAKQKSNARLISAAPDLFAALQALVADAKGWFEVYQDETGGGDDTALHEATEALKKAGCE